MIEFLFQKDINFSLFLTNYKIKKKKKLEKIILSFVIMFLLMNISCFSLNMKIYSVAGKEEAERNNFILQAKSSATITEVGLFIDTEDYCDGFDMEWNTAIMSKMDSQGKVINVSDPSNMILKKECYVGMDTKIWGPYVFTKNGGKVCIDNWGGPGEFTSKSSFGDGVLKYRINNTHAFTISNTNVLDVYDIANKSDPIHLGGTAFATSCYDISDMEFYNSFVYLTEKDSREIKILDAHNPSDQTIVANYVLPDDAYDKVTGIILSPSNSILYVENREGKVLLLNISDPSNPTKISEYLTKNDSNTRDDTAYLVAVNDSIIYVKSDYFNSFQVVDVSSPSDPIRLGIHEGNRERQIKNMFIRDSYLFVFETDVDVKRLIAYEIAIERSTKGISLFDSMFLPILALQIVLAIVIIHRKKK